jgi:diguanylate cyclase (GGDEF)-like protein
MIDQLREQRDSLKTEMDTVSREMEDLKRSSSAEKEEYSRLEDVAYRDTQTGTHHRHYGMKILGEWLASGRGFYLVFVDMDLLKYVNDVYGHQEGDVYIKTVADLLREASPLAVISRLGGDEFMVLLKRDDARDDDMNVVFERLRAKLGESSEKDGNGKILYCRSMSFGIVEVDADSRLASSDILSLADERMYEYKKKHKKERRE